MPGGALRLPSSASTRQPGLAYCPIPPLARELASKRLCTLYRLFSYNCISLPLSWLRYTLCVQRRLSMDIEGTLCSRCSLRTWAEAEDALEMSRSHSCLACVKALLVWRDDALLLFSLDWYD